MTITLTPETEARLREKAEREGQDISAVADALIAAALEAQERVQASAPPPAEPASIPPARRRRREIGRRLDALGPEYRASPEKQARVEALLARKETLTPTERAELDELRREFDEIMLRRAEALDQVL